MGCENISLSCHHHVIKACHVSDKSQHSYKNSCEFIWLLLIHLAISQNFLVILDFPVKFYMDV